jgi:Domain of unknown function (DUF4062)
METIYQVFVSSTYADLKDERRQVSETLAKAGFVPAGELFPAADQQQLEFIQRVIDRCDYYVVMVGGRYGSLADDRISFTEGEYEYALSKGLPVLAFLHGSPEAIPVGKTDENRAKARKLKAFRDRLATGRLVDYWNDPAELCTKVVIAIANAVNLSPGVGWVRGNQAADPAVYKELEELRKLNQELQAKLSDLETVELTFPPHLSHGEDEFEFPVLVRVEAPESTAREKKYVDLERSKISLAWNTIFFLLIGIIYDRPSESTVKHHFQNTLKIHLDLPDSQTIQISPESISTMGHQFEALGLIRIDSEASTLGGSFRYTYHLWEVTEKGRHLVAELRAIRRKPA